MVQVPQGIIQLATHPPFGILSRETLGPLTAGLSTVHRIRGPVNVDSFGLSFSFITIPAGFGRESRVTTRYELPICQFAPLYTDLGGHAVHAPPVDVFEEGLYYYFNDLFPTQVDVWVNVGCTVTLFWLVAL